MNITIINIKILLIVIILFTLNSCGIYSFTGASISADVKTISIQFFENQAPLVQPTLSQTFTEDLKDRFISQTSLEIINGDEGDLNFEGAITGYNIKPMAIQGNETAALNRLTITVKVKFTNNKEPERDFNTSFSAYEDYESSQSIEAVEENLIKQIVEKLTEDIFNKSVANW